MGVPRKLTHTLAALMAAQSLTGVMAPEQYRDVEWIKATWYGNDWLTLIVAVPLLLMSSLGARRGSARAFLLWAGAVGYAVYNYAYYLTAKRVNAYAISDLSRAQTSHKRLGDRETDAIPQCRSSWLGCGPLRRPRRRL